MFRARGVPRASSLPGHTGVCAGGREGSEEDLGAGGAGPDLQQCLSWLDVAVEQECRLVLRNWTHCNFSGLITDLACH